MNSSFTARIWKIQECFFNRWSESRGSGPEKLVGSMSERTPLLDLYRRSPMSLPFSWDFHFRIERIIRHVWISPLRVSTSGLILLGSGHLACISHQSAALAEPLLLLGRDYGAHLRPIRPCSPFAGYVCEYVLPAGHSGPPLGGVVSQLARCRPSDRAAAVVGLTRTL